MPRSRSPKYNSTPIRRTAKYLHTMVGAGTSPKSGASPRGGSANSPNTGGHSSPRSPRQLEAAEPLEVLLTHVSMDKISGSHFGRLEKMRRGKRRTMRKLHLGSLNLNGPDAELSFYRASSTASVSSSILEYRTIRGRTYHSERHDTQYFTPNDQRQSENVEIT